MLIKPGATAIFDKESGKWTFKRHKIGSTVYDTREDGSLSISTEIDLDAEPSLAQQQFEAQCNINNIMKGYMETGTISHLNPNPGVWADVSRVGSLREAYDVIQDADDAFMRLPASVRSRFNNDPLALVDFCLDPKNLDEAIKMGIVPEKAKAHGVTTVSDDAVKPKADGAAKPSGGSASGS